MPQVTIDHPDDMPFGEAVSYVRAFRAHGEDGPSVYVPNIEVAELAPDHFLVRRIQPTE